MTISLEPPEMGDKKVKIDVPYAEIERRTQLRDGAEGMKAPRPPARASFGSRFWLHALKVDYERYRADVEYMIERQAFARKWLLENIYDDSPPRPFENDRYGSYVVRKTFGCRLEFVPGEYTPWVASHPVSTTADLEQLRRLDVNDNPVAEEERRLMDEIERLSSQYTFVYADGRETPGHTRLSPSLFLTAPFSLASDVMGMEALYVRLMEDPPFVHELLDILVQKYVDRREFVIANFGGSRDGLDMIDDDCSMLSPATYMEFQAPRLLKLRKKYPAGRFQIHIDGQANQFVPIYGDVLKINRLWGFGPMVDKQLIVKHLGGRCRLLGNIDPVLLLSGPAERIREACMEALAAFAPCGGFTLMDGNNIAPGTPLENIAWMRRCCEEYARR